jgi:hypothetical protein
MTNVAPFGCSRRIDRYGVQRLLGDANSIVVPVLLAGGGLPYTPRDPDTTRFVPGSNGRLYERVAPPGKRAWLEGQIRKAKAMGWLDDEANNEANNETKG